MLPAQLPTTRSGCAVLTSHAAALPVRAEPVRAEATQPPPWPTPHSKSAPRWGAALLNTIAAAGHGQLSRRPCPQRGSSPARRSSTATPPGPAFASLVVLLGVCVWG